MSQSAGAFVLIFSVLLPAARIAGQSAPARGAAPAKEADYSGESFIIEQISDEVIFSDDGTGQEEQTARVRIQSDAGVQRFGVLSFPYRNERDRLDIVQIRVTKPDGSAVDTPESSVQDLPADVTREAPTYSDLREKQIPVKALAGCGKTAEIRVTREMF